MRCEIIRQSKECPDFFAKFLLRVGGRNPYGQPNFRLVWGPSTTTTIWGQMEGGSCGQHVQLKYGPAPLWHLEMWKPPEMFGTPEEWYEKSYDSITGYHVCGDYPFHGDYAHHSKLNNLNYRILEELIPKIQQARGVTFYQRKMIIKARMEAEEKERLRIGKDAYLDASPAFGGVAGTYESNREAWTRKYEFPISAQQVKERMGTGHSQFDNRIEGAKWIQKQGQG